MYENASAPELSAILRRSLSGETVGASIDRLSMLLLRAVIANYHPEAAELSLDWDECGLSCGQLYDSNGAVIEDFEPYDDTYPEDLISLASNVRSVGDMRDVVDGPNNGPFRLRIR